MNSPNAVFLGLPSSIVSSLLSMSYKSPELKPDLAKLSQLLSDLSSSGNDSLNTFLTSCKEAYLSSPLWSDFWALNSQPVQIKMIPWLVYTHAHLFRWHRAHLQRYSASFKQRMDSTQR